MAFSEDFINKNKPILSKYTMRGFLQSFTIGKLTHDSANWSYPNLLYRARIKPVNENSEQNVYSLRKSGIFKNFEHITGSKRKANQFHQLLEGDYEIATEGFYTNNKEGLRKLFQAFPEMFKSIQSQEQFKASQSLVDDFIKN